MLLGCCVSLIVSGRLTARLVVGSTIAWSFIPLVEVAALAIVRRRARRIRTFARDLDLISASWRPWAIFLVALASVASFLSPRHVGEWAEATVTLALLGPIATGVALRSGYLDFRFYRDALARAPARAFGDVLLQRAITWTSVILYFFGHAGWPLVVEWMGL